MVVDTAFCTPYDSGPRSPMMLNSKTQSWFRAQSEVKIDLRSVKMKNITFNEQINQNLKIRPKETLTMHTHESACVRGFLHTYAGLILHMHSDLQKPK